MSVVGNWPRSGGVAPWIRELDAVGSTQDEARILAEQDAPPFSYVVAAFQSGGRGRHGRSWHAPPGTALTMSVVLRPAIDAARLPQIAMAVGVGTVLALDELTGSARVALKWPNDLVVAPDMAKLGGILIDSWTTANGRPHQRCVVVAGIGINLTASQADLPAGATSLMDEELPVEPPAELARRVVGHIARQVAAVEAGGSVCPEWRTRLATLGRDVVVRAVAGEADPIRGRAVDVGEDGGLVVETTDGTRRVVHAADVTLAAGH